MRSTNAFEDAICGLRQLPEVPANSPGHGQPGYGTAKSPVRRRELDTCEESGLLATGSETYLSTGMCYGACGGELGDMQSVEQGSDATRPTRVQRAERRPRLDFSRLARLRPTPAGARPTRGAPASCASTTTQSAPCIVDASLLAVHKLPHSS